jgi:hypothetical protein
LQSLDNGPQDPTFLHPASPELLEELPDELASERCDATHCLTVEVSFSVEHAPLPQEHEYPESPGSNRSQQLPVEIGGVHVSTDTLPDEHASGEQRQLLLFLQQMTGLLSSSQATVSARAPVTRTRAIAWRAATAVDMRAKLSDGGLSGVVIRSGGDRPAPPAMGH